MHFGHTGITFTDDRYEDAIRCIAAEGFEGIELFGWILDDMKQNGQLGLFEQHKLPLVAGYFAADIHDAARRDEEIRKIERWTDILASQGGRYTAFGAGQVDRRSFDFKAHLPAMVDFVNECGRRMMDKGVLLCFHPHTGTPIEARQEIEALLDAVDPSVVFFAPDVAQIEKGGGDALALLRQYRPMVRHVHFKDFCGKVSYDENGVEIDHSGFACYSPLGEGVMDLAAILKYLEQTGYQDYVMAELDSTAAMSMPAEEGIRRDHQFLKGLGYMK